MFKKYTQLFGSAINQNRWLVITLALSLFLVFFKISNQSLTLDEAFTAHILNNWSNFVPTIWFKEANMWFYYLILHFWTVIGISESSMRTLSAVLSFISLLLIYRITRLFSSKNIALTATLLTSTNFFFIFYAQDARSYSLSLVLSLLATYSFLKINTSRRYKVIYILSSILGIYSHFYVSLVIASHLLPALIEKKTKTYIACVLLIVLGILPIFISPSFNGDQMQWLTRPTISNIFGVFFLLSGDFPLIIGIYAGLLVLFSLKIAREIPRPYFIFLVSWLVTPIIISFLISWLKKPIFQSVYFLICLPAFMIIISLTVNYIKSRNIRLGLIFIILIFSFLRLNLWYSQNTGYKWVITNKAEEWKETYQYVSNNYKSTDTIIFYGYYSRIPFEFYDKNRKLNITEISSGNYNIGGGALLPEPDLSRISKFKYPRVWLVLSRSSGEQLNRNNQRESIIRLLGTHYNLENSKIFSGITVNLYSYIN